jgi:AraC family transcriptional regulator of adaptative response/methylated-DNA-[protein]-cysteine methyltransferase
MSGRRRPALAWPGQYHGRPGGDSTSGFRWRAGAPLRTLSDMESPTTPTPAEMERVFRAVSRRHLGAPPLRGQERIRVAWLETPLGPMVAAAASDGLCLLEFTERHRLEKQLTTLGRRFRLPLIPEQSDHFARVKAELDEYFAGRRREFGLPLRIAGSEFQQSVWRALRQIPYGETRSYTDIALAVGSPRAIRAVGQANGANPIAIVVPCHRVVNAGGRLGGYGGGLWRKRRLLALEQGQSALEGGRSC